MILTLHVELFPRIEGTVLTCSASIRCKIRAWKNWADGSSEDSYAWADDSLHPVKTVSEELLIFDQKILHCILYSVPGMSRHMDNKNALEI